MPLLQHNNFPLYIFFSPSPKRQVGEDFQIFDFTFSTLTGQERTKGGNVLFCQGNKMQSLRRNPPTIPPFVSIRRRGLGIRV
jgi:hypothetical protein